MFEPVTLAEIRAAAETLANARNDVSGAAALLNAEIKAVIGPVVEKYRETLDTYAAAEAQATATLQGLLDRAPHLFIKPRSMVVDGVRCGYRKQEDSLDWDDDEAVIARIQALRPELFDLLVRTLQTLNVEALSGIDAEARVQFGIRTVTGVDSTFITIGDNDVEKIAKLVVIDASRRQGEDEAPKTKKSKAKLKVAA